MGLIAVAFAAWAFAGCGNDDLIGRYCNYGARSKAQYDGCVDHVDADDVARAQRNGSKAAEYAEDATERPATTRPGWYLDADERGAGPAHSGGDWRLTCWLCRNRRRVPLGTRRVVATLDRA